METSSPQHDFLIFRSGMTHIYLLPHAGKYLLVDAGMKQHVKEFFSYLLKKNIEPSRITHVLLTHTHYDHTGALSHILELTHSKVLVHKDEADSLAKGYTPAPYGTRLSTKVISFLGRKIFPAYSKYDPVEADLLWEEGSSLPWDHPVRLIHTPGHTEGSISVIWRDRDAFVGDTLFGYEKDDCLPWFANDLNHLAQSWEKLLDTGCETFYPAHGRPVKRELLAHAYQRHFGS